MPIIEAASDSKILDRIRPFIGDNILLWGSQFIGQKSKEAHGWHLDVEFGKWKGLTVWVGLKNLNEQTTVSVVTRSHLFPTVPRELFNKMGLDIYDDESVLREARKIDPKCEMKHLKLKPGEFIIWSGKAWHATRNQSNSTRYSVIFQYCSTEEKAFIPLNFEYPNTKWSEVPPPCALVSGVDNFKLNKTIPARFDSHRQNFHKLKVQLFKARFFSEAIANRITKKAKTFYKSP